MNRETYVGHNSELCGRCIQLGHSCQNEAILNEEEVTLTETFNVALVIAPKNNLSQKKRKQQAKVQFDLLATDERAQPVSIPIDEPRAETSQPSFVESHAGSLEESKIGETSSAQQSEGSIEESDTEEQDTGSHEEPLIESETDEDGVESHERSLEVSETGETNSAPTSEGSSEQSDIG
jgi:hypothetical protein